MQNSFWEALWYFVKPNAEHTYYRYAADGSALSDFKGLMIHLERNVNKNTQNIIELCYAKTSVPATNLLCKISQSWTWSRIKDSL